MFGFDDAALATAAVGGLGFIGQQMTNSAQAEAADKQMEFQQNNSNTAYQRQVADLQAAGLNPMLAYIKGGGASTPTGAMPTYTSPVTGAVQAVHSAAIPSSIRKTEADTSLSGSQAKLTDAQVKQVDANVEKIGEEISNLKTDNLRLKALTDNLVEQRQNLIKEGYNLTETGNVLRATVDKLIAEVPYIHSKSFVNYATEELTKIQSSLSRLDLNAAEKFDNFGREYKQYAPIIDLLKTIFGPRSGGITINKVK
jgi:hypothetical protein